MNPTSNHTLCDSDPEHEDKIKKDIVKNIIYLRHNLKQK